MELNPLAERLAARLLEGAGQPVATLIVEDIWEAVVDGSLEVGERLPTARELAVALRVSPRIVERAYDELERLGVIATRLGEGTAVSLTRPSEAELERRKELRALSGEVVERARALGFEIEELLDALAEYRETKTHSPLTEA